MEHALSYLTSITDCPVNKISYITKNLNKFYSEKVQPKMKYGIPQRYENKTIKLRELTPSIYPLKKLQENIHKNLLRNLQLPDYAYGSVDKRNNILNALQHCNNNFFLSIDLRDYFFLIKQGQVLNMFLDQGFTFEVATLLTRLTTYNGFLPQGPPTSPTISNLVFIQTGVKLLHLIKDKEITFSTYLDDLTFSSKHDFKTLIPEILQLIRNGSFYPHPKKIHYRIYSTEITGLIVRGGHLFFPKKMQEREQFGGLEGYKKAIKKTKQNFFNKNISKS